MGNFLDDTLGFDSGGGGLGGLLDPLSLGDPLEDAFKSISGQTAQDEAAAGARRAEEVGQRAITVSEDAQKRLEETLAPFVAALGTDLIPQVQGLFGENAGQSILNDPALKALQDDAERRILAAQAARGRTGAGETPAILQDAFLRTGADLLSRQRGDLLSALGVGQSSAAQTGFSGVNTARGTGDLLTQIANAQTAGALGGAQARSQGLGNLINLGASAFGAFG